MTTPIHNDLKKKRLDLKLSAPDLAEILQTKLSNIYKWEAGMTPRNRNLKKSLSKFIDGFYDSSIQNGRVNFRILNELRQQDEENNVKTDQHKPTGYPTITLDMDPLTAAVVAQELTIKLLQKEIDRLLFENQKMKELLELKVTP